MTVPADPARQQRQLQFLADAGALFVASLDADTILRNLARLAVPDLAEACIVELVDEDGRVRRVAVAHLDPTRAERASDAVSPPPGHHVPEVIHAGRPLLLPAVDDEALHALARGPDDAATLRDLGLTSAAVAPLVAGGRTVGAITLASIDGGRTFDEVDLAFVSKVAERAAMAVDNARLLRRAQDESRVKDEFLGALSHELRAPLNAIVGWAHVLRSGTPDRALIERAVEAIDRNATLQAQLISTVLDPSRIGEGAAAARTPASPGEDRESKGPLPALDGTRVLVVDDEEDTRSVVAAVLEQRGARVSTAASVNGAMARLADEVPDVVLADIGMPDEDGYSLMRRIRALPPERGGTVPAAALTAYARSEDRMQALLAGYQVHVPKPVQPAELIKVVATLAARRSATRTPQGA